MAPIIGILASAQTAANLSSYESIATTTVGAGGAASVTFSSIPSTYKHLQIRGIARSAEAVVANLSQFRFNSDTAGNYSSHVLYGDGSAGGGAGYINTGWMYGPSITAATATSGLFNGFFADILDYANTSKYKTIRSIGGQERNGAGDIRISGGNWRSTSAINSITIFPSGAVNWVQYTSMALYGIKG